jgi:glycosyltransferase involved in cell wall biosynthesis
MNAKITVIIATYNAGKTIRTCLDSIFSQKDEFVELLIIDGGSNDNTISILSEYDSQIDLLISEKDNGIYDAWNKGVANAHGDWIMFLGADDTLEQDAFRKYRSFIASQKNSCIDYICAKNTYIDGKGQVLKIFGVPWRWQQFRRSMKLAHVGSLHRRTLFEEIGPYNTRFRICGDYELLLRKRHQLRCLFLDDCIARMAINGASYSMKALWEAHQAREIHSKFSFVTLVGLYCGQVTLFLRHKLVNMQYI